MLEGSLEIKGEPFRVSQSRYEPDKVGYKWDLNRAQMRKILEITEPTDWEFRNNSFLNDWQWDPPKGQFKPMTKEALDWIKQRDLDGKRDRAEFITGERDNYGNKVEPRTFEIWNVATHHVILRPTGDFVKFELENLCKPRDLTDHPNPSEQATESRSVPNKRPTTRIQVLRGVFGERKGEDGRALRRFSPPFSPFFSCPKCKYAWSLWK